jgi:molecular chaperone Hsp33
MNTTRELSEHHERDRLQRFLFEHAPVRGQLVSLDDAWREVLARRAYPPALRTVLGELMAASALLAATLKFEGVLVLQIQGSGPLRLLVVECQCDLRLRATARFDGSESDLLALGPQPSLRALSGDGRCAITLDPRDGRPAYQGVVPLEGSSVAGVLQEYMARSEQLDTRFHLAADEQRAAGLLLQKLPASGGRGTSASAAEALDFDPDLWNRACILAETLTRDELLSLDSASVLRRLFHQQDLRLFESLALRFHCTCSRDKVARMLRMVGEHDVREVLAERGQVSVECDFCHLAYEFGPHDVEELLGQAADGPPIERV